MKAVFAFILFLFLALNAFAAPICGNTRFIQNRHQLANAAAQTKSISPTNCDAEAYYDTTAVYEKRTSHFQIFYVLDGVHATTEEFVDSLAQALESAWTFYIQKNGYTKPVASNVTWQYQKNTGNLYPIEIADINSFRDARSIFGGFCGECSAVTLPFDDLESSEIIIDNDFFYSSVNSPIVPTAPGSSCTYYKPNNPMINSLTGKDYSVYFGELIRATAFHELYHSIQFVYVNPSVWQDTYWYEASASAQEEIGAPDVNDYWRYLPLFFTQTGKSFHTINAYGICLWDIYNESTLGYSIAKKLWARYSSMQDSTFETVFAKELTTQKKNPDSIFADFAKRLFFSGPRSVYADSSLQFIDDSYQWTFSPSQFAATTDEVTLESPAIAYYRITSDSFPDLTNFKGEAQVALYGEKKKATFYSLDTITIAGISSALSRSEYATLILSRLRDDNQKKAVVDTLPMRSYPNPWRGETHLCFTNLPENKKYLEIRTRVGKLVDRFDYTGIRRCIDANELKDRLAPGLYYFRAGNKAKLKPFLVVY